MPKILLTLAILLLAAGCTQNKIQTEAPKQETLEQNIKPEGKVSEEAATKKGEEPKLESNIAPNIPKTEAEQDQQIDQNTLDNIRQDGQIAETQDKLNNIANNPPLSAPPPVITPPAPVISSTIDFGNTLPLDNDITSGTNILMWQNTITIGLKNVELTSIKFRHTGSLYAQGFSNLRLFVNDIQISSTESLDSNGYAVFNFSPVTLSVGDSIIKMTGNTTWTSTERTITWRLDLRNDITFKEQQSIKINWTFPLLSSGTQRIKGE